MKQFFVFLSTGILIAGACLFVNKKTNAVAIIGDPMEESAQQRLAYEFKRLADPDGKIPEHMREKELAFGATLPSDLSVAMSNGRMLQTNWDARGPWNLGGRTRALGIDILNEQHLITGSTSGGIWTSTDGGNTWTKVSPALSYHGITSLVQDQRPGRESTWYAGSGEPYGQSASGGSAYFLGNGMMKSTDNGATWTILSATSTNTPQSFDSFWDMIWNTALDQVDTTKDVVYSANLGAIYRSINGGTNWTTIMGGNTSDYSYFSDIATTPDSGIVYVTMSSDGPQNGIWRSTNQGTNWVKISTPQFGDSLCNRVVMGINPSNTSEIYFLGNTSGIGMPDTNFQGDIETNVLWRYTYVGGDGSGSGGIWEDLSMQLPTGQQRGLFSDFNAQGSYDLVVRVKPDDANTVFIGGTNVYRNTNRFNDTISTTFIGGYEPYTNFPFINSYANHHPDIHTFNFLPSNPNVMLNTNDGGVFRTNDCMASLVTWTSLNNGYLTSMFYTVAIDHGSTSDIVCGGAQDNGTWWTNSSALTTPWAHPRGGDGSYCAIEDGAGMYYFSIQNGKMNKATLDGSGNITAARRIDPIGGERYQFINPFTLDPNNQHIMYLAGGKYLWRNDDLSAIPLSNQWDSITTNWIRWNDSVPIANIEITAVHACKTPANRVYYGTDRKRVYRVDNANTGTPTPVDITYTAFPPSGYVSCITSDPNDGNKVLVTFSNYGVYSMYYSTNGGTTWDKVAGNLEQNSSGTGNGSSIRWVSILPVSDGKVYLASTSIGLFATDTLKGLNTSWVRQGSNTIGSVVCDMTDVRQSDGLVLVATHSNGMYSAHITSVNDIVTVHDPIAISNLQMNAYPNPAKEGFTLQYTLKQEGAVEIVMLDELGRPIRLINKGEQQAGEYREQMNTADLAAGVYYVRLRVGEWVETKAVMVVE
jgi:Secretion system C-terminal sorting domain